MKKLWVLIFLTGLANSAHALGTLTLPTTLRMYTMGANTGFLINPDVIIINNTLWGGGSITYTIDAIPDQNLPDRLSATATDIAITTTFDPATRKLTITAPNTVNMSAMQATCRTVKFSAKGQLIATRNITST